MQVLPTSLQESVASQQYKRAVHRNMHIFNECSEQFLKRFMTMLTEICLMPGESVLKTGEIARDLSFVQEGALTVTDVRGTLIELITGEGTAPSIVGSASFLMGTSFMAVVQRTA
jgi:hypothetical protein